MNETDVDYLLNFIPDNVDYTEFPSELDEVDISQTRINGLLRLLENSDHNVTSFRAACLLCSWGKDKGIRYLMNIILSETGLEKIFKQEQPDDICLNSIRAIIDYLSIHNEIINYSEELDIRKDIIHCIKKIIHLGKYMKFSVKDTFLIVEEGMKEILPDLENYFLKKSNDVNNNFWLIYDFIIFLNKNDNSFLTEWIYNNPLRYNNFLKLVREVHSNDENFSAGLLATAM